MNTTVIIILIGCATLLAFAAIICDSIIERKMIDSPESLLSKKIIKVHRNYIAGFLGFAIIMLFTATYGGPDNCIYEYLSFGSTITSLVLSILAIFVTVRSSMELNKQFGSINNVSKQIDDTLRKLDEAESRLNETSSNISNQVNTIAEEVEKRLGPRFDKNEELMSNMSNLINANNSQTIVNNQIDKESFLLETPRYGLFTLYACVLTKEKEKSIMISELFDDDSEQMYALGFIVALKSMGLLHFDHFSRKNIICKHSIFTLDEIVSAINSNIESITNEETKNRNSIVFDKIKKLFDEA